MNIETCNTILYCEKWSETTAFYRDALSLPVNVASDWMIEFAVAPNSCLSVADARRTSIQPSRGAGITLTFKVADLNGVHAKLEAKNIAVDPIRDCKMGGQAFFLRDPEGNRLEFWADSPWSSPEVVARFSVSRPNEVLMQFAAKELNMHSGRRLLDIGCGAGCNAVPLAQMGWDVLGLDLSEPMLNAATQRAEEGGLAEHLHFKPAPMDKLPVEDQCFDFIVAHGIWNLARSVSEFRKAVREAARTARPDAALFIFTFSRNTFPPETLPMIGEPFVFTKFSGRPQCFLTETQLIEELANAGFVQEPGFPINEYPSQPNSPKPAIYEGVFRRTRNG
jgi:2-polyprenyl-3-methyl-5-hydroxy-6-metoxy-1,4-benzoquinol methylase/predicted enzyme related to lactoylglutathione lyase